MIVKHPNIDKVPFHLYYEVDGCRYVEMVNLDEMNKLIVSGEMPKRVLDKAAAIKAHNRAEAVEEAEVVEEVDVVEETEEVVGEEAE